MYLFYKLILNNSWETEQWFNVISKYFDEALVMKDWYYQLQSPVSKLSYWCYCCAGSIYFIHVHPLFTEFCNQGSDDSAGESIVLWTVVTAQ